MAKAARAIRAPPPRATRRTVGLSQRVLEPKWFLNFLRSSFRGARKSCSHEEQVSQSIRSFLGILGMWAIRWGLGFMFLTTRKRCLQTTVLGVSGFWPDRSSITNFGTSSSLQNVDPENFDTFTKPIRNPKLPRVCDERSKKRRFQ